MKSTARVKAKGYIEGLLKYEKILTAQIFLRIFEHTSPQSKYLQTSGMELLTAHHLVVGTEDGLKNMEVNLFHNSNQSGLKCFFIFRI